MASKDMHGTPSIAVILSKMHEDRGMTSKDDEKDDPRASLKMALGTLKDALMSKSTNEDALADAFQACVDANDNCKPSEEPEEEMPEEPSPQEE